MAERFTLHEVAEFGDALTRRGLAWSEVPPCHPQLPWETLSGFADSGYFLAALARSWPIFPQNADRRALRAFFNLPPASIFPNPNLARALLE